MFELIGDKTDEQLTECMPKSWLEGKDDAIAQKGEQILIEFVTKFDGFFTILNNSLEKPCQEKEKEKDLAKKNPPLTFIQKKITTLRTNSKTNKIKKRFRTSHLEDILKTHAFVVNSALEDLFKSEFYVIVRSILQCYQTAKNAPVEFSETITIFLTNIKTLQNTIEGFIDIIVDAICNWNLFKETLESVGKAKLEKDPIKKWEIFGEFFFDLIKTFGTKDA